MSDTQRTWTEIGKDAGFSRTRLAQAIELMEWESPEDDKPMSQALGVSKLIKEFRIPKVSAVSLYSVVGNRYSLLGVEGNYKNGRARVYAVDKGSELIPVASDFWPTTDSTD